MVITCVDCEKDAVEEENELISFPIVGGVELCAVVPVMRCSECKFAWFDFRAEEIKDEIVRRYYDQQKAMETPVRRS